MDHNSICVMKITTEIWLVRFVIYEYKKGFGIKSESNSENLICRWTVVTVW